MSKYLPHSLAILAMTTMLATPPAFAATPNAGAAAATASEGYADARAHIENLISQYLWAFDTQDEKAFAELFAADGEVVMMGADIPTPIVFHGHQQLMAFIDMIRTRTHMPQHADLQFSPNIHLPANLVLTVNDDEASGKLYWFTVRRGANVDEITRPNPNPAFIASLGRYEQEYVKQNGKWMFKRVTIAEMPRAPISDTVSSPNP